MRAIGDRTSELALPSDLADVFEVYLDFLYRGEELVDEEDFLYNVKHGLALYKMAEFFEIVPLRQRLAAFYKANTLPLLGMDLAAGAGGGDLHSESGAGSQNDASKKNGAVVMVDPTGGVERFAKSMHRLEFVEEEKLDPTFLLRALKKRKELGLSGSSLSKRDSENISCLVALSTKYHCQTLTRSTFYRLTQEEHLPHIDQEAALQLLTIEVERGFWTDTDNFSTVQARCIQSLLADWKGLRQKFESDGAFWKTLRGLSPNVLGILLMQSSGTVRGKESQDTREALATSEARETKGKANESRDDPMDPPAVNVPQGDNERDGVEISFR